MKKTTYVCDICQQNYNYITNQNVSIMINSYVVKQLGDVCDKCMGHLNVDTTLAIENFIKNMKTGVKQND